MTPDSPMNLDEVLQIELAAIRAKRAKCLPGEAPAEPGNLTGIALSGGGIRSATICLGVLDTLNRHGLLARADYLSSVSGGGYTGGYLQATLRKNGAGPDAFNQLFAPQEIERLREFGDYLVPGKGWAKFKNLFVLVGAYLYSFAMNSVWVLSLLLSLAFLAKLAYDLINSGGHYLMLLTSLAAGVFCYHFFLHGLRNTRPVRLWSSRFLFYAEGLLLLAALPFIAATMNGRVFSSLLGSLRLSCGWGDLFNGSLPPTLLSCDLNGLTVFLAALLVTGFFANPNILTFHRFYRDRLAEAYLKLHDGSDYRFALHELNPGVGPTEWGCAPYPLINACLNLLGQEDPSFEGTKSCDYFLLSPLFCGSKLTGYTATGGTGYREMTLPTAVAISGAALNPGMGTGSNRVTAFVMTLLNLRLGYWAPNPRSPRFPWLNWWPYYYIMELLSRTNSNRRRISLSDGGHIENLGIYELLRRKCRLIVAIDADADPNYAFADLQKLIIRARNELGVTITFRQKPEELIRPVASYGFSRSNFVLADIAELPGKNAGESPYQGLLVYIKSSLKPPIQWENLESDHPLGGSYHYKIYHPAFPHEPTSDQFFDRAQWEAYYYLGRFMAEDLLTNVLGEEEGRSEERNRKKTLSDWFAAFDVAKISG